MGWNELGGSENSSSARLWYAVEFLWTPEVPRCCCTSFSNTKPLQGRHALTQILEPLVLCFIFLWSQHQNWHEFCWSVKCICSSQKGGQCLQDLHVFPGCYTSSACFPCIFFSFLVWKKKNSNKKWLAISFVATCRILYNTAILCDHKTASSSVSCCWKTASKQV